MITNRTLRELVKERGGTTKVADLLGVSRMRLEHALHYGPPDLLLFYYAALGLRYEAEQKGKR